MSRPHVLVMPAPAQGHVIPLLEFSQCLAKHGFRVTFVNTDYDHMRVVESLEGKNDLGEQIRLVSIPDGMEPWEDRNDLGKLTKNVLQVMPDGYMAWSMEVAKKMNVRGALFWPSSAASVALLFHIPKLIDDGIIDSHGTPMSKQMFRIAPNMPEMNSGDCFWTDMGDLTTERILFDLADKDLKAMRAVNFQLCHSTYELEAGAFAVVPDLLPIGPLLASNRLGNTAGHFWREDSSCLEWLDQQQPSSVIYAAFGSFTILDQVQFQELALGLELCNRPFLWVVRPDITTDANDRYPEGFQERVAARGRMIGWAPQQKVGLRFDKNENGIIGREEIKNKVEQVLGDQDFEARALKLKGKAMNCIREGGSSRKTFQNFLEWIFSGRALIWRLNYPSMHSREASQTGLASLAF
ncbi:hypothetical protein AB3S75_015390 [Citrus x aurantiifolia]